MRYLCSVLLLLLSLASCGGGGAERVETTVVKEVTKGAVKFFGRAINFEVPPLDTYLMWAYMFANAGGLFIFTGFIMLWLMADKLKGGRMIGMGFSFVAMAKVIEISKVVIDDWTGILLFLLTVLCMIYVYLHYPKQIEKVFLKFGLRCDIDGDGKYGTDSHEKEPSDPFNEKDTEVIPSRGHA